jgi:hypothetical protein
LLAKKTHSLNHGRLCHLDNRGLLLGLLAEAPVEQQSGTKSNQETTNDTASNSSF